MLYRQFLFRVFDGSALGRRKGDATKYWDNLRRCYLFSLALRSRQFPFRCTRRALDDWCSLYALHFLIATTMLVVGLFAVLCWDATLPDQRALVLAHCRAGTHDVSGEGDGGSIAG